MEFTELFKSGESVVTSTWLGLPNRRIESSLPRLFADRRVSQVMANVREFLSIRIPGPNSLGAAKIRNTRIGGNTGACQRDHALEEGQAKQGRLSARSGKLHLALPRLDARRDQIAHISFENCI